MPGILDLLRQQVRKVTIDGVDLFVRPMGIRHALELEQVTDNKAFKDKLPTILEILSESLCNEDGTPLVDLETAKQALERIGLDNLMQLFQEVMKASGIGEDEEDDLLKNSPAPPA